MKMKNKNVVALILPDKVDRKIQPPMTKTQMLDALVKVKIEQLDAAYIKLHDEQEAARFEARKHIARCMMALSLPDMEDGAHVPSSHNGEISSATVTLEEEHMDKACKDAILLANSFDRKFREIRTQNGLPEHGFYRNDKDETRKAIRKHLMAQLAKQAGTDSTRVDELLKKPAVKTAFENMLAQLEGSMLVASAN
jgi:hypothetical protein